MFHVGQKVECIYRHNEPSECVADEVSWIMQVALYGQLELGKQYTISNVFYVIEDGIEEELLELVELPIPDTEDWYSGFYSDQFRPLTEQEECSTQIIRELLPA